jgi:hypothetical protein
MTFSIGFLIILKGYKDGVSNVHTWDFIKEIFEAFMENHHLVKKKVVILLTKLTTKNFKASH